MSVFFTVALAVWAALNGYAVWRLQSVIGWLGNPRWLPWVVAAAAWASFPLSFWLRAAAPRISAILGVLSTNWLGVVFLLCTCFIVADLVTLGGVILRPYVPGLRAAAAVAALLLTGAALIQGHRDPVVRQMEVNLPGLPASRDGTRVVFVSDLHLGAQIGAAWVQRLGEKIDALRPDLVLIGGDLVDHDVDAVQPMLPELRKLRAPLGVWAVLGNHDVYSGPDRSAAIMEAAGYRLLRDASAEAAPGLRLAGVDDIGVRGGSRVAGAVITEALRGFQRGSEGCILISHTPDGMEEAAAAGVGLMVCGHTHGGQLWPFGYLVQLRYPTLAGRYAFGPMTLLVSRGAGTWGPRMRLWEPGELQLITLHAVRR